MRTQTVDAAFQRARPVGQHRGDANGGLGRRRTLMRCAARCVHATCGRSPRDMRAHLNEARGMKQGAAAGGEQTEGLRAERLGNNATHVRRVSSSSSEDTHRNVATLNASGARAPRGSSKSCIRSVWVFSPHKAQFFPAGRPPARPLVRGRGQQVRCGWLFLISLHS